MTTPMPRDPSSQAELHQALAIVGYEYGKPCPAIPGVDRFGELFLFTDDERDQLHAMRELIRQYVARPDPRRPLSLAVFGPPGSGKSFAVEQILNELKLTSTNVNLTQASDASALGEVLAHAARSTSSSWWWRKIKSSVSVAGGTVPVIFFDEFDAPRDGAPYGWLAWFLAPMQDGKFLHDGDVIPLRRAVYVFAGGTAATMRQFSDFDRLSEFQRAKGPDFISRLRGFLDVYGPNAEPRMLRRAILFRAELSRAIGKGAGPFLPDPELMTSLLQAGRYRHGARSIAAVVDLSHLENKPRFGWEDLPKDHLLGLHVDRGPLDAKLIGGSIAFSGYDEKAEVEHVWCKVAQRLWNEGATLSYAGRWASGPRGWLMKFLQDELRERPPEPSADAARRGKPDPWLETFLDDIKDDHDAVDAAISVAERDRMGLKVTFAPHLTDEERAELDRWLRSGLEHFRRRLAVADASVARFVVAGARSDYYGRFPGIPEEVMLTLAQGKPVYIAGAFGGAAADVGSLLGLAHPRRGEVPPSLQADPREAERTLSTIADKLRPGPWKDLPITAAELAPFLKAHALGGPKWPDNALTFEENRRLFASNNPEEVADLVLMGLLRLFAKADPVTAEP
jgi:SLOG cluster2/ATPase family associated with various cellular activities (AAA)